MTDTKPQPDMNALMRAALYGRDHERRERHRRAVAERLGFTPANPDDKDDDDDQ